MSVTKPHFETNTHGRSEEGICCVTCVMFGDSLLFWFRVTTVIIVVYSMSNLYYEVVMKINMMLMLLLLCFLDV